VSGVTLHKMLYHGTGIIFIIIRRHHWQAISPIPINVTIPLSVCLSHSCIVLKRQKISPRILCVRHTRLSQITLTFGL